MHNTRILATGIATILAVTAIQRVVQAVDGTWTNLASSSWATTTNWLNGIVASGTDATADFSTLNITANATVTLDGARTVGTLKFGDTTASNDWILNTGTAGPLTLDVTTGTAAINVVNRTATIGAVLAGTRGITTSGAGTLVLGGANTFTGGLGLSGATIVTLNNANAAGTSNVITYAAGTTGRVMITGGISLNSGVTFNIGSGITNTSGRGLIEQSGAGQATVNGAINITGGTTNGGTFLGNNTVGNELILGGLITSSVPISQRDGRVIYRGGGTGYSAITVTGTILAGATNGISTAAVVTLGGSGNATLDLNGFDQSLAGVVLGNSTNNFSGTVNSGAKTLSLTGNITSISATTGNVTHLINGTGGGGLNVGAAGSTIVVTDTLAADDVAITGARISGAGEFTKVGTGTLALSGVNVVGGLTIAGGTLQAGRFTVPGNFTTGSLTFGPAETTLRVKIGAGGDTITTGALTTAGPTTLIPSQFGGILPVGNSNIINYTGASPGVGGFVLVLPGHATGSLVDTGTAIALNVTSNDRVVFDGTNDPAWNTATPNFKLESNGSPANYIERDEVIFPDNPVTSAVDIAANVEPARVSFLNTVATTYTVTGAGGIVGSASLVKTGDGLVTLRNPNSYGGATTVSSGTLELDHDAIGNVVLSGTSGVSVAAGAKLLLTRDDGGFTFSRDLSGSGTLELNAHSVAGSATSQAIALTGNSAAFNGMVRLLTPLTGTYRITSVTPASLGNGSVEVQTGAQLYTAAAQTYANAISIAGTGFVETAPGGSIGALRLENGSNWAGNIVVNGSARIGAHNATATVSGAISGGDLSVNAANFNNTYTLIFTGANSYGTTTIGGNNIQTAGVPSYRLNIGNGGTNGTLGLGSVLINGDGANGVLGFDRSDGYTLLPGQTITAASGQGTIANSIARTFIDFDTLGAGFSDNGNAITLGSASITTGGQLRVGQSRAGAIASFSGALTAGTFRIGSGQGSATANLNVGAVVNVERVHVGLAVANTTSTLNIKTGSALTADYFTLGELASVGGIVNQAAGSTVNIASQLRIGHFATETGIYNMSGGTLTLTGASPLASPSTAVAGSAGVYGDANLNTTNPATILGGGIYIGIDGTGILNQTGGTLTTNWIVLDNRTDTIPGLNMSDGIDRYNLSGAASVLALRSTYGFIQRNASAAVSFGGGTVKVDNSGTGTGTGANINIPLDATIDTVASTTTKLDTNGAGNSLSLLRDVRGTGTLNLTGGGTIIFSSAGAQSIAPAIIGSANIAKGGGGTTTLSGIASGFTGNVAVSAGRLNFASNGAPSAIAVADGAALGGEPSAGAVTFGTFTGAALFFDPNTAGALTAGSLTLNGTTTLDFSAAATGSGPFTVLNYGTLTGTQNFVLANAASYRASSIDTSVAGTVKLNVTTKSLTFTGTGAAPNAWDQNSTANWTDGAIAETFYAGDSVLFDDSSPVTTINVSSGVSPFKTSVNSGVNNFTFASAGNGIAGSSGLQKFGSSTLTITGTNSYSGQTVVGGGIVDIAAPTSLGNASATNTIALLGGGRLRYSGTTAVDLGATRAIAVGSGGGVIAHSGGTAVTLTIPGSIAGSDPLRFSTTGAGTASSVTTYNLTGDNSGYTGDLTVDATSSILSTLTFATQLAVPNASSITVNFPSGSLTNGNATILNLPGVNLPAATTLNLNSNLNGAISQRSQVTTTGASSINGPIKLSANAGGVVQFSPAANSTLTLNGDISEASPGAFGSAANFGVLFLRTAGNTVVNGKINLPTALLSRVDDTGSATINSTGNVWALTDVRSNSTLRIGANNALAIMAPLRIGQASDGSSSVFDLNGFNQEIAGLDYVNGNAANTRRVTNSSATPSILTINNTGNFTFGSVATNGAGNLTGALSLVKLGSGTQTLAGPANTYTGNVTINAGTLVAGGNLTSNALGSPTTAGRTITVNNAGTLLSFATNNVFGSGIGNANLPAIVLNLGTTLSSARYNVLGAIMLNGATLTQSASDAGAFEGFAFKGGITVIGSTPSTIATGNGKADHLDTNTIFNVADVTGSADTDLILTAPLRDQSGDFGSAAGGLTKTGAGTLEFTFGNASSYTGPTVVNAGTLLMNGSISGSTTTVNVGGTIAGNGTLGALNVTGGTVAPGNSPGTLSTGAFSLDSSSTLKFELAQAGVSGGGVNDFISATGALSLGGTLQVTTLPGFGTGSYPIISYAGALTGSGLVLQSAFLTAYPGSFIDTGTANIVSLVVVPEPNALLTLVGGCATLLGLRRRRA